MGYPNRDFKPGGRSGSNYGRSNFGGNSRPSRPPELHHATCATCGKDCEVPFKPTGERPVYCRDCFAKNRSQETGGNYPRENRDAPRPAFKNYANDTRAQATRNEQIEAINSKLDQILRLLSEKPAKTVEPTVSIPTQEPKAEAEEEVKPAKKKRATKKAADLPELTPINEETPAE